MVHVLATWFLKAIFNDKNLLTIKVEDLLIFSYIVLLVFCIMVLIFKYRSLRCHLRGVDNQGTHLMHVKLLQYCRCDFLNKVKKNTVNLISYVWFTFKIEQNSILEREYCINYMFVSKKICLCWWNFLFSIMLINYFSLVFQFLFYFIKYFFFF